jgi:hypothetical protein
MDDTGHFYKSAEAALTAPKSGSKCSHIAYMLRFFAGFWLVIIALIEFIEMPYIHSPQKYPNHAATS